jgi:hypothetical protein
MPAMTHFERKRFEIARDEDKGAFELSDYDSEIDHLRKTLVETVETVVSMSTRASMEELSKSIAYVIEHGSEQIKSLNSIRVLLFLLLLVELYRVYNGH